MHRAGYVTPLAALVIGGLAAPISYYAIKLRQSRNLDESLDVWACHGMGGVWGALATGLFATKAVNEPWLNGLFFGNPNNCHLLMPWRHHYLFGATRGCETADKVVTRDGKRRKSVSTSSMANERMLGLRDENEKSSTVRGEKLGEVKDASANRHRLNECCQCWSRSARRRIREGRV
jgi:hypothetical protein